MQIDISVDGLVATSIGRGSGIAQVDLAVDGVGVGGTLKVSATHRAVHVADLYQRALHMRYRYFAFVDRAYPKAGIPWHPYGKVEANRIIIVFAVHTVV